jgi:hypothetical protein
MVFPLYGVLVLKGKDDPQSEGLQVSPTHLLPQTLDAHACGFDLDGVKDTEAVQFA